jgi:hypothetical protein
MGIYTTKKLIEELQERMTGKGATMGTLISTSDPSEQHLVGVEQFLKYEPDDKLIVTIWSRSDYPEVWDLLMDVWHHRDDDRLVEVTREVIEDVLSDRTEEPEEEDPST